MTLFMDIHEKVEGLTAEAVANAHKADLEMQGAYGVDYQQYWFDEGSGKVFCLVEAPDAETATGCTARRTGWSPTSSCLCTKALSSRRGTAADAGPRIILICHERPWSRSAAAVGQPPPRRARRRAGPARVARRRDRRPRTSSVTVLVEGPAGIGKTRVVDEFGRPPATTVARRRRRTLRGPGRADCCRTHPLVDLLASWYGARASPRSAGGRSRRDRARPAGARARGRRRDPSVDGARSTRLFQAARALLQNLSFAATAGGRDRGRALGRHVDPRAPRAARPPAARRRRDCCSRCVPTSPRSRRPDPLPRRPRAPRRPAGRVSSR